MGQPLTIHLDRPVSTVQVRSGALQPAEGSGGGAVRDRSAQVEALRRELQQALRALQGALESVSTLKETVFKDAEEQLLALAVEIARKVLMQEIQAQRYQIEPIVKEALAHVPPHQEVSVHLNPQDLSQCQTALEAQGAGGGASVRFVSDPAVPRAECVLRTAQGLVVSSMEGHLQSIAEALTKPE